MKTLLVVFLFLLTSFSGADILAQRTVGSDTGKKEKRVDVDSLKTKVKEDLKHNMYGQPLNDDTVYNKRYPIWRPSLGVIKIDVATNLIDRYVLGYSYVRVDAASWKRNLNAGFPWGPGWEWDKDRLAINFIAHPLSGAMCFNAARADGYNFYQSIPFSFAGSYLWKIFGENGTPEREDLINTTVSGVFLGEILYRLSSDILDDRTWGTERVFREVLAGIVDPVRGINRLIQGKSFRLTQTEVYQKEPVNITFYGGVRVVNRGTKANTGPRNPMVNIQLDYGNAFEVRPRKPFDVFRIRADMNFAAGKKLLDHMGGYAFLFGKNGQIGKLGYLLGGFQGFDYWNNQSFELSTIGAGMGMLTKLALGETSNLYVSAYLNLVPFSGVTTQPAPDTASIRDYVYSGGAEGKMEISLNYGKYISLNILAYYYWLHTYVGPPGENFLGILEPKVSFRILNNLSIGYQHSIYSSDNFNAGNPEHYNVHTEQRVFLVYFFEDRHRKGHYN